GAPAPMRLLLLRRTDASVRGVVASPDQVEPTVASASEPEHAKAPHRGGGLSARVPPTGFEPALPPWAGGVLGGDTTLSRSPSHHGVILATNTQPSTSSTTNHLDTNYTPEQ